MPNRTGPLRYTAVLLKYLCLKYTRVSPMIDVTGLSQRHLTHIMLLMEDLRETDTLSLWPVLANQATQGGQSHGKRTAKAGGTLWLHQTDAHGFILRPATGFGLPLFVLRWFFMRR